MGEGPKRDDRQGQQREDDDGLAPPDPLRQRADDDAADQRADVVDDHDSADGVGVELALHLEKLRVQVLRPVRHKGERRHQQDEVEEQAAVLPRCLPPIYLFTRRPLPAPRRATL